MFKQQEIPINNDLASEMYSITEDLTQKNKMPAYEVSNYSKEGRSCSHNLNYWEGGRGAPHSLFNALRDCNIFLENLVTVPGLEEEERLRWLDEVKVLKAFYHFWLMQMYGPIPIVESNISVGASAEETNVFRDPVDDVVNYFCLLAEKELYGEIFNIGQTEEISIKNLADLIIQETNSNSEIVYKPHKEVYGDKFEDPMRRTPSIEKIVSLTGIKPSKKLEEMIEEIIRYKANLKK